MGPEAHAQATLAAPGGGPPEVDPPLSAGAVIDRRYRVVRLLGEGGMGRVYEAEHLFIRRRLALKLVRRDAGTGEAAARLLQEAMLAGKVPHPTVVPVFDCAALPDGQVYVAMELLRGESLEQALARPQPAAEALRWLVEVARGLAAAHRAGIVHRDVKPANIFLARTAEGAIQPKILDFGIAKLLPGGAGGTTAFVRTQAGSLLGTPFYMAPERARGEPGGPPSDLYSLGVILYEALTGAVPFDGGQFMEIVGRHVREAPLDPRQAAPGRPIPDALAELTLALLGKDPAARPADGDAVARELQARIDAGLPGLAVGAADVPGPGDSSDAATRQVAAAGAAAATQRIGAGPAGAVAGPEDRTLGPWSSGQSIGGVPGDRASPADPGAVTLAVGSGGLAAPAAVGPAEAPHSGRPAATLRVGSGGVGGVEAGPEDSRGRGAPTGAEAGPEDSRARGARAGGAQGRAETQQVGSGQIGGAAEPALPIGRRAALAAILVVAVALGGALVLSRSTGTPAGDRAAEGTAAPSPDRGEAVRHESEGRDAAAAERASGASGAREASGEGTAARAVSAAGGAGEAVAASSGEAAATSGATDTTGGPPGADATGGASGGGKRPPERAREPGKKPPRKAGTTAPTGRDAAPKIKIDVYDDE